MGEGGILKVAVDLVCQDQHHRRRYHDLMILSLMEGYRPQ